MGSFVPDTAGSYFLCKDLTFLEALERAECPWRDSITCWFVGQVGLKGVFSQEGFPLLRLGFLHALRKSKPSGTD